MTERLYHSDPYRLEFDAVVLARRDHQGRPAVILDRTAFYAESGGQPWDKGWLDGVEVLEVREQEGQILHVLAAPLPSERVHGRVDGERRRDHRQQHHGQHLLSRALLEFASARTVSFHLGDESSSIDLDRPVGDDALRAAERLTNEVVWQARPVRVRTVTRAQAEGMGVAVPSEAGEEIRLVEAEGFDLQPCGGTHPHNTAEVGVVLVLDSERYKGGSRVRFVCGHRALGMAQRQTDALQRLGTLLSSPLPSLPEAVQRLQDQLAEADRRSRDLLARALEGEARRLLAEGGGKTPVVSAVYDGWNPEDLRALAVRLTTLAPCVAILASRGAKSHLVFAQSEGLPHDIPALLRQALIPLDGRGGGRGNLAQGGGRVAGLEDAIAWAAAEVRSVDRERR